MNIPINRIISKSKTLKDGLPVSMMVTVLIDQTFLGTRKQKITRKVSVTRHVHLRKIGEEYKYIGFDKDGSRFVFDHQGGIVRNKIGRPERRGNTAYFVAKEHLVADVAA